MLLIQGRACMEWVRYETDFSLYLWRRACKGDWHLVCVDTCTRVDAESHHRVRRAEQRRNQGYPTGHSIHRVDMVLSIEVSISNSAAAPSIICNCIMETYQRQFRTLFALALAGIQDVMQVVTAHVRSICIHCGPVRDVLLAKLTYQRCMLACRSLLCKFARTGCAFKANLTC